jgi:hypothetical protein
MEVHFYCTTEARQPSCDVGGSARVAFEERSLPNSGQAFVAALLPSCVRANWMTAKGEFVQRKSC